MQLKNTMKTGCEDISGIQFNVIFSKQLFLCNILVHSCVKHQIVMIFYGDINASLLV